MIVQMGTIRHPDLPDVPSWVDVAKTLDDKKLLWNVAPRVHDLELKHYVDLMLRVRAGAYSFEAANPRHEHEWQVWEDVKLLPGKMIMPGVVSHCVTLVEHPELVAQRIVRYANVVGRS